ncbi:hypothetical protein PTTG_30688 [Puccinia triticina 1-1 BBBD Race 1]|uniref:Uncharacterized protein n=1 Tax=Puccinia triticina (isolate 1-1 / race 1 (BBBD)) TaxID=630390 RepID=A0A180FXU7_PUCT1|nr:hypothetical protein PTTG_30688 [Puccinia triticina 1-1 BBBD Race 1]
MPELVITCMAFPVPTPSTIVVGCATNELVPGWAVDLSWRLAAEGVPEIRDPLLRLEFAHLPSGAAIPALLDARLWGISWIGTVAVSLSPSARALLLARSPILASSPDAARPRAASVAISCKVQNLLRVTRLDDNETPVLVERPFFDLLRHTNSAHGPAALALVWQRTGAYGT